MVGKRVSPVRYLALTTTGSIFAVSPPDKTDKTDKTDRTGSFVGFVGGAVSSSQCRSTELRPTGGPLQSSTRRRLTAFGRGIYPSKPMAPKVSSRRVAASGADGGCTLKADGLPPSLLTHCLSLAKANFSRSERSRYVDYRHRCWPK